MSISFPSGSALYGVELLPVSLPLIRGSMRMGVHGWGSAKILDIHRGGERIPLECYLEGRPRQILAHPTDPFGITRPRDYERVSPSRR